MPVYKKTTKHCSFVNKSGAAVKLEVVDNTERMDLQKMYAKDFFKDYGNMKVKDFLTIHRTDMTQEHKARIIRMFGKLTMSQALSKNTLLFLDLIENDRL